MKKIYMQPQTLVVKVKTDKLLNSGSATQRVVVTDTEYEGDAGGILSRGGSIWDDEEEY